MFDGEISTAAMIPLESSRTRECRCAYRSDTMIAQGSRTSRTTRSGYRSTSVWTASRSASMGRSFDECAAMEHHRSTAESNPHHARPRLNSIAASKSTPTKVDQISHRSLRVDARSTATKLRKPATSSGYAPKRAHRPPDAHEHVRVSPCCRCSPSRTRSGTASSTSRASRRADRLCAS